MITGVIRAKSIGAISKRVAEVLRRLIMYAG